jgi:hypothetical protein
MKTLLVFLAALMLLVIGASASIKLAFVDAKEDPGSIYSIDLGTGELSKIYTRDNGRIYTAVLDTYRKVYFADPVNKAILETALNSSQKKSIFTHKTNIKDIELRRIEGNISRLYFSDAMGAGGNGVIYYLDRSGEAQLYYNVGYTWNCTDVAGHWDGNFAFDDSNNLYLSNGNRESACIYKIPNAGPDRAEGNVTKIYTDPDGPIMGMQFVSPNIIYFADHGTNIYRLNLDTLKKELAYSGKATMINDVCLLEGSSLNRSTGKFVGSEHSTAYHDPDYRWAKEIRPHNQIWFTSSEEAEASGYKACRVCKPNGSK